MLLRRVVQRSQVAMHWAGVQLVLPDSGPCEVVGSALEIAAWADPAFVTMRLT